MIDLILSIAYLAIIAVIAVHALVKHTNRSFWKGAAYGIVYVAGVFMAIAAIGTIIQYW